jgi:hypothetical protein
MGLWGCLLEILGEWFLELFVSWWSLIRILSDDGANNLKILEKIFF